jgi:hypothetical protein
MHTTTHHHHLVGVEVTYRFGDQHGNGRIVRIDPTDIAGIDTYVVHRDGQQITAYLDELELTSA